MKVKLMVILSFLIVTVMMASQGDEERDQDVDAFIYRDDVATLEDRQKTTHYEEFQSAEKLRPMENMDSQEFEELQQEIDDLIGIHDEAIDKEGHVLHPANMTNIRRIFKNNKKWVNKKTKNNPDFFKKHQSYQKPDYLWIGCSDSRLPANEILGLDYGEVFVLRNVANMVSPSDISSLAVIQYAVEVLQVKDIIVAGHYGCGGVKAAILKIDHGPLEAWLSKLRRIRHKHAQAFAQLSTVDEKAKLLVEINVKEQVFNVASTPFVQKAWKQGKELRVHGVVFDMQTGRLVDLHLTMHRLEQIPDELALFE